MKRAGNLIKNISDMYNLREAFCKARKGKSQNNEVINFCQNLDSNLLLIRMQILTGNVSVGEYKKFKIFDPKERIIIAAPFQQRVLHHALMNICHPVFEKYQIFNSYASRKNKGTCAALNRAFEYSKKYDWFLKLDCRKYFDSISHFILKKYLSRLFKEEHLLNIFEAIIDSYHTRENYGLPIGNITSQYFANHFLAIADHFVLEKLAIPAYVRYMDDMVLWHNEKDVLLQAGKNFNQFLNNNLDLLLKPFCFNQSKKGLPFLGYLIFPGEIHLAKRSKVRFIKKYKEYENNLNIKKWNQEVYYKHITPLLAFTKHANAKGFRRSVIEKLKGQIS